MFLLDSRLAADTLLLGSFPLSQLLLMNESRYPWFILVPQRENIVEWLDLSEPDRLQLHQESMWLAEAMRQTYSPTKLNIANLGNIVRQFHLHHIARFESDPAWPGPVWGKFPPEPYSHGAPAEVGQLIAKLSHFQRS